ncbi:sodium-dependent nutrient amino acid transporter 1-like isoform X2 [Venturia canescens]|nr:sodium-dependent nutrient amino acid transporter 1-like isoform X2 [Venturia canescens]
MESKSSKSVFLNEAFADDLNDASTVKSTSGVNEEKGGGPAQPPTSGWNNSIEFLMSCVAMSVGFGNIWRFPFTAYENGGGAFLVPYIILLILVGKPFYYLEMIVGQFSGRTSIKVWNICPGFAGLGWGQMCSTIAVATYYSSLMALNLYYLINSFTAELPWSRCDPEWTEDCVDSSSHEGRSGDETFMINVSATDPKTRWTSAELYFSKVVLKEKENIDDGVGTPDWKLSLCLLGSWVCVCLVLSRGIKSTGKASYFLAIFPYVILLSLLGHSVTLEGAVNGIVFFITPVWSKLLNPSVWYAAVTQCFFSLNVCFGAIVTYSSHNDFRHNIYRDVLIVTTLDTLTSIIAGCTIFGILGNLAHEMGTDDISSVVRAGTGLAFVSYPDAIAKFRMLPQLFAVLFFLMMFVLGVGCAVGQNGSIISGIAEQFPHLKYRQVMYPACILGFLIALVYVTPGGQFILTLVDYYCSSFVAFVLACFEMVGFIWVYGFENFLDDVEFMLRRKPSFYWRFTWLVATPLIMIVIFFYTVLTLSPLMYGNSSYPWSAHTAGIIFLIFGAGQIPVWILYALLKNRQYPFVQQWKKAFSPSEEWGPRLAIHRQEWLIFKEEKMKIRNSRTQSKWVQNLYILFGLEPKT